MAKLHPPPLIILAVIAVLVAGAAAGLAFADGVHAVIIDLLRASLPWIALTLVAQAVAYWAYVVPYKHVFGLSYQEAVRHAFEGFQPYRPEGGFWYDLSLTKPTGTQVKVLHLSLWEYAALAPLALAAAVYAYLFAPVPKLLVVPWIVGVPTGVVLFVVGCLYRRRLGHRMRRLLDSCLQMLQKTTGEIAGSLGGMLLYWAGEIVAVWSALQLFNISLGWAPLIMAYVTGYAVTRRSLPLGGAGIVLVLLSFALSWVGVGLAGALLAALAYQVSNLFLPLAMRAITH